MSSHDDAARLAEIREKVDENEAIAYMLSSTSEAVSGRRFLLSLLDAQQKQINGLQDYVWHRSYCPANEIPWGSHDCTCGLSAVLKGGK